jgi:hypothetical protein
MALLMGKAKKKATPQKVERHMNKNSKHQYKKQHKINRVETTDE